MHRLWAAPAVGLLSLLCACGGTSSQGSAPSASDCSVAGENAQILSVMQSWYYWYQTLPGNVNPANYASTNALLDALRQQPLDRFSYITTQAANQSFYGAGQYVGYGLGFALSASNNLSVNQVFPGSPADQAGLTRGGTVTAVNGVPVPTLVANNQLDSALGADTPGVNKTFTYTSLQSQTSTVTLTSAVITQPSVGQVNVFDDGRERVGYFLFNNFIDTTNSELDQAFAQFASQGVTHVVIDERYNGGGEVSVAQHLASLIAGNSYAGKSLATLTYNDKHTSQNETITFPTIASPLNLTQVFFITTESSASASEFIINALKPFIDVVTVGAATFGKPVGEDGFNLCTDVLYPITFKIENVSGYGDYFNGLPATCPAADDLGHALGDRDEASLAAALSYIRTQSCPPQAAARPSASRATPSSRRVARGGWRQLINAY